MYMYIHMYYFMYWITLFFVLWVKQGLFFIYGATANNQLTINLKYRNVPFCGSWSCVLDKACLLASAKWCTCACADVHVHEICTYLWDILYSRKFFKGSKFCGCEILKLFALKIFSTGLETKPHLPNFWTKKLCCEGIDSWLPWTAKHIGAWVICLHMASYFCANNFPGFSLTTKTAKINTLENFLLYGINSRSVNGLIHGEDI